MILGVRILGVLNIGGFQVQAGSLRSQVSKSARWFGKVLALEKCSLVWKWARRFGNGLGGLEKCSLVWKTARKIGKRLIRSQKGIGQSNCPILVTLASGCVVTYVAIATIFVWLSRLDLGICRWMVESNVSWSSFVGCRTGCLRDLGCGGLRRTSCSIL